MFEHWSEHRRRWFLLTFTGVGWALFLSAFAHLGPHFSRGGIGPDAAHAASVIGTFAVWVVTFAAFRLRLRHWAYAALLGFSLSTALIDFGLRDHAAAGVWSLACDGGEANACSQLAKFYADGRSPMHGGLDAERLHRRACELRGNCVAEQAVTAPVEQCAALADYEKAASCFENLCRRMLPGDSLDACEQVLDSGFHHLRVDACEVIERTCVTSSDRRCRVAEARCVRVRSPHAGVR